MPNSPVQLNIQCKMCYANFFFIPLENNQFKCEKCLTIHNEKGEIIKSFWCSHNFSVVAKEVRKKSIILFLYCHCGKVKKDITRISKNGDIITEVINHD